MDVALIPGKGLYSWARAGSRYMVLGHMVGDTDYMASFSEAKPGKVTIDCGEAEGQLLSNSQLIVAARKAGAREIVIPDALGDAEETRRRAKEFMDYVRAEVPHGEFTYMGACQGTSIEEAYAMAVFFYADLNVMCVGLPRLLMNTTGQLNVRLDLANQIYSAFPDLDIHLLGTSPQWRREVFYVATHAGHVRSVDTSMPFNYSIGGHDLRHSVLKTITRPDDYFTTDNYARTIPYNVEENVATFKRWANGLS